MKRFIGLVLLWCLGSQGVRAEEPALLFPPMTGQVVDAAQMLDIPTTARLSRLFQEHEQATGEQLVVVTLVDLQGTSIEDYAARLAKAWGVGQKGKNNGALLVVSRDNRKVRLEVGSGLQDRLGDAQASVIINMLSAPQFHEGNFAAGIEQGARAMVIALGGHVPDEPELLDDSGYATPVNRVPWPLLLGLGLAVLGMATCAMTNLGRRMRLKGSSAGVRHDPSGSRNLGGNGRGFGGGGACGNW